jgi:hypothetical protein
MNANFRPVLPWRAAPKEREERLSGVIRQVLDEGRLRLLNLPPELSHRIGISRAQARSTARSRGLSIDEAGASVSAANSED